MYRNKLIAMFLATFLVVSIGTAVATYPIVDVGDGQIDAIGSTTTINIILNEASTGLSGYNLTVALSNPSIAEIVSVSFPSWATLHINSTLPADSIWMKAVDLNDQVGIDVTDIDIGTLTLRGDNQGTSAIVITVTKMDDDSGYPINPSTDPGHLKVGENVSGYFDTGSGTYPSIFGTHTGEIRPNQTIAVSKLYTYPCSGTGGHSEYVRIWNNSDWNVTANWAGYTGDWHNVTFSKPFILLANKTYNYTITTGSYPQIIHQHEANVTGGTITCTKFTDANGRVFYDWIPAIKLFL